MTDVLQRTTEWHQLRLGKPTASRFGDIKYARKPAEEKPKNTKGKSVTTKKPKVVKDKPVKKWADGTLTYMLELLAERITGQWVEKYGASIEWGTEHEDEAREAYEAKTGNKVDRIGFAERNGMGDSPDGLVGTDGCIEIKCPYNSAHHLDYLLNGCADHYDQMQAHMYFNNRQWCDFISYDPRMPEGLRLYIERVERDGHYIYILINRVAEFAKDLDELERRVKI